MDAFSDSVTDVISKGVLYYANLPQRGASPGGKCKLVEGREEAWQASIYTSNSDRTSKVKNQTTFLPPAQHHKKIHRKPSYGLV
jgi:hypothetical protein